jgi:hypothetical protein
MNKMVKSKRTKYGVITTGKTYCLQQSIYQSSKKAADKAGLSLSHFITQILFESFKEGMTDVKLSREKSRLVHLSLPGDLLQRLEVLAKQNKTTTS